MDVDLKPYIDITSSNLALHQKVSQGIIDLITKGILASGQKLPTVNRLSENLGVHRLTVLRALEELEAEGWINKQEKRGCFVNEDLPVYRLHTPSATHPFSISEMHFPEVNIKPLKQDYTRLSFNDGYPDHRFIPHRELARAYSTILRQTPGKELLLYHDLAGYAPLLIRLQAYLQNTRSINFEQRKIMITRGSTMGLFLAVKTILQPGDTVAMGKPGYHFMQETFTACGLKVIPLGIDDRGLIVDDLIAILKKHRVKMVYVTPHHHHPTAVSMPAERRLQLLGLAKEHGFIILEDDYDFDFHYDKSPTLPIISLDPQAPVIYCGGFSKSLSPALRIGFLAGPPALVENACRWRKLIDRQGDTVQEATFELLLKEGTVEKAIRKARKAYRQRRDHAYTLLQTKVPELFEMQKPQGGLAFWARVNSEVDYPLLRERTLQKGLHLVPGTNYIVNGKAHTRLGFASMTEDEMEEAVSILSDITGA